MECTWPKCKCQAGAISANCQSIQEELATGKEAADMLNELYEHLMTTKVIHHLDDDLLIKIEGFLGKVKGPIQL